MSVVEYNMCAHSQIHVISSRVLSKGTKQSKQRKNPTCSNIHGCVYMYILIYVEAKRLCFVLACNAIVVIYFLYLFHNFWTQFNGNRKLRNDKNILIATDIESICTVHALSHTYSDNVNKIVYYWCHEIAHLTEPNRTEPSISWIEIFEFVLFFIETIYEIRKN